MLAASALKTCPATLAPARAELCTGSGGTSKTLAPSHCYHGQGQRHPPHHGEPRRVGGGSRRRQPQQRSDSAGAAQGCPKRQHMGGLRPARGESPPVLLSTTPCPAVYYPMPRCLPPHAPLPTASCPAGYHPIHPCGAWRGVLVAVAAVKTRRRLARTLGRVRGAGTGMEPSLGYGRCGSL